MNKTKIDFRKYFKSSSLATTTVLATPTVIEQSNESTVNNTSTGFTHLIAAAITKSKWERAAAIKRGRLLNGGGY